MKQVQLHATAVAVGGHGVLIMGPPGAGKSDLALRLIDQPGAGTGGEPMTARLIADDQTIVSLVGGRLILTAPERLKGLLEIRGLGIVAADAAPEAPLILAVELAGAGAIERMPDDPYTEFLGVRVPLARIDAGKASAPARVRAALLSSLRNASAPGK